MQKLSIIIPCYNESKTILSVLNNIAALDLGNIIKEIIIINDASTDSTKELLEKNSTNHDYKLIHHQVNQGKTNAIISGLKQVTGDYTIIQDADLEYDPQDIKKLVQLVLDEKTPVVYGSRRLNQKHEYSYLSYYLGANFLTWLSNHFFKQKLTDVETCYKLIKTDLLKDLNISSQNFLFENEVTAKLAQKNIKIQEVPISYNPRSKKQGKKIKFRHGVEALILTFKHRYKKNKNQFFTFDSWLQKRRFKKILKHLKPNTSLLDLGCGYDCDLKNHINHLNINYHGLDYKLNKQDKNLYQINLEEKTDLPFESENFNQIISLANLEHLTHYNKILKESYRILKSEGVLYLTTPTPLAKPVLETLALFNIINPKEIDDHKQYFSKKWLVNELTKAGFQPEKIKHQYFQTRFNQLIIAQK